ncbi:MAG: hypothetical protein RIG68_22190 [Imperialibacter sp.]|uniref:hypothetical protein n=1 Tax=Imperialibacter sp. TaxID=2038411 RepID=UPI0032EFA107
MTLTTQNQLAEWILKLEDEGLLDAISQLKESSQQGDWYTDLTGGQKESIYKGMEDHKNGRTLSSEDFWKKNG